MTNEELDECIEREFKANRPVAAGALLMLRCIGLPPNLVTKPQGEAMQECFTAGVYYALALLRGAGKATGAAPLSPGLRVLFEKLYEEVQDRTVMGRLDIEAQFADFNAGTKH
jgi:hypothetical protein